MRALYPSDMPLSDHEKRLLAEMERALASDDPRLVDVLNSGKVARPRVGIAIVAMLAGLATLLAGLISKTTLIGVAGFAIALAGLVTLLGSINLKAPRSRGSFSSRLEQRWDRRNQ